jgi:hypothetical protein
VKPRLVLAALLIVLTGCGSTPEPRSLSTGEAERLALVRFTNFVQRSATFTAAVPSPGGKLFLTGRVDFTAHVAYAALRTEGRTDPASAGLLQWNLTTLAFHGGAVADPVDPPPTTGWQVRELQRTGSELDGALRLLMNLASDRPDNAQLLEQSSARWLRTDTVDGAAVDVLEGPQQAGQPRADDARLRYWVDGDGKVHRLEARLGNQPDFAVFDLKSPGAPIIPIPAIATQ